MQAQPHQEQESQQQPPPQSPPPQVPPQTQYRRLYRSETDRVLGGVAGGMAEYFAWDPNLVRLLWAITILFGGVGFLLYLVLWLVVPTYSRVYGVPQQPGTPTAVPPAARPGGGASTAALVIGGFLVVVGALALLSSLGVWVGWNVWAVVWPVSLIVVGAALLIRR